METVINIKKETKNQDWKRFVVGDNNALKSTYLNHHAALLMTAYYYLKNEEEAKDIVADIFKKLLEMTVEERKEKLVGVNEKLATFLKVLVKNKCLDYIKVEKNRTRIVNSMSAFFSRSNSSFSLVDEDFKLMLDTLPERQKEVLALHLEGYDNNEISEKLDITYNTCRNTLSTSKKKIRELWITFMT